MSKEKTEMQDNVTAAIETLFDEVLPGFNAAYRQTRESRSPSSFQSDLMPGRRAGIMALERVAAIQRDHCAALHLISGPATDSVMLCPTHGLWLQEAAEREARYGAFSLMNSLYDIEPRFFRDLESDLPFWDVRNALLKCGLMPSESQKRDIQDGIMAFPHTYPLGIMTPLSYQVQSKTLDNFCASLLGRKWHPEFVRLEPEDFEQLRRSLAAGNVKGDDRPFPLHERVRRKLDVQHIVYDISEAGLPSLGQIMAALGSSRASFLQKIRQTPLSPPDTAPLATVEHLHDLRIPRM